MWCLFFEQILNRSTSNTLSQAIFHPNVRWQQGGILIRTEHQRHMFFNSIIYHKWRWRPATKPKRRVVNRFRRLVEEFEVQEKKRKTCCLSFGWECFFFLHSTLLFVKDESTFAVWRRRRTHEMSMTKTPLAGRYKGGFLVSHQRGDMKEEILRPKAVRIGVCQRLLEINDSVSRAGWNCCRISI